MGLQIASKKGCKNNFYKPEPHCFWGKNCKKIKKMYKKINLNTKIFKNPNVNTDDFWVFILDHLKKTTVSQKKFLKRNQSDLF